MTHARLRLFLCAFAMLAGSAAAQVRNSELEARPELEPPVWGRAWFWVTVGSTTALLAAASAGAAFWWLEQGAADPCRGALDWVQAP